MPLDFQSAVLSFSHVPCAVCLTGGDAIPLRRLTVDQVGLLLEGLNLGDYVAPFRAAAVDGNTLHFSHTREDLKEDKGVDMTNARFRMLRAAVEEYAPLGVPMTLLNEAQGRVRQREQEAADAALAQRLHQEQAEAERQIAQQREREANVLQLKAQAPRKV